MTVCSDKGQLPGVAVHAVPPMTALGRMGAQPRRDRFPCDSSSTGGTTVTNLLSEDQLAQLSDLGYLKLPAAIPVHDALAMRARMWEALAVGGADPEDRSTWRTVDRKALKRAVQHDAFAAYASPTVRAVADQLLGPGRWGPPATGV